MATKKTTDPWAYLETVAPAGRRRDALVLLDVMRQATGLEPRMAGSIIAFGEYAYEYDSGRKGTAPAAGFSPRKPATVVYLLDGIANHEDALAKLGPHKTGVGCLYLKDLSKTDLRVLKAIVRKSFKTLTASTYKKRARDAAETKAPKARSARGASAPSPIDAYLTGLKNAAARATLTQLCAQLRELLPEATETISYDMPAFRLPNGKVAAGFAFFGKNCGYYPHSGGVIPKLGTLVDGYNTSKGGITFPPDAPLPKKLVSALVRMRLAEISEKERAPKIARTTTKRTTTDKAASPAAGPNKPRVFAMSFASVYPLYVRKAEKKGRTQAEVDEVIAWLTGYRGKSLERAIDDKVDVETFFGKAPRWNPKADRITGVVCGVRVENVADPLMQKIRYLDKLIDELAKGKTMASILRQ